MKNTDAIELRNEKQRQLAKDQIRLRVTACGICGTDILGTRVGNNEYKPFGHEIAGIITEIGAGVTGFNLGQSVVLDSATPCGRCDMCRNARQGLCTDIQSFFNLGSFGMAEEMIAPAISAIPCNDLDPAVSTLSEPLGVAIDVVRMAEIETGNNILVMGPGPIGLMVIRLARLAGAGKIYVTALSGTTVRNKLAREFGANEVIEVDRVPLDKYKFDLPIERVISTTPPATLLSAMKAASKGAIIAFIGLGHGDESNLCFDANEFHFKKLQLRASFASPALFGPKALALLRSGKIDGKKLISHKFKLDEIQKAMRTAVYDATNTVKVVVIHDA